MPQPHPRQQSGFNDIQMLQRHIMFKQLQEVQRQQQLQELGDAGQQNYVNQLSMINKQASGGQFPPLINGTPIHEGSQMFMLGNLNLLQRGASPVVQGFANGLAFSQAQSQPLHSVGLVPQQLDASLYGTPVASAGNNLNQYSHLQGATHDSANVLTKGINNQVEKPTMQSSAFMSDQCNITSDQVCMPDGAFISKQVFQEKNLFGQVPIQGFDSGVLPGNFQQVNTLQRNASVQEFGGRQEQASWPGHFPGKTTKVGPSQGLASLDPLEEKILFNMDDNSWEASFGRRSNMGTGGFENALEHTDYLSAFPSIQNGSWSALMQSAVAEVSSSDTGLQEEWSGLSFQNPDMSTDNQAPNFVNGGKLQTNWVDNNLQSAASLSSKPELLFNDSNMSSSFHGFRQPGIQFPSKQREGMRSDSSHESIQQSPRNASKRLDCNPQQKLPIEGSQPVQTLSPLQNAWPGKNYESSENAHQPSITLYTNCSQPCNNLTGRNIESPSPSGSTIPNVCDNENAVNHSWAGDINGAAYKDPDNLWKTDNNYMAGSFSDSVGGLKQVKAGKVNKVVDRENSQLNNFAAVPKSSVIKVEQETRLSGENCFRRENSNDSYHSNGSQHAITGHELRRNMWLDGSESRPVEGGNQKSSGQVCQNAFTSSRVLYHPTGNLGVNTEHADNMKHVTHSQVLRQQVPQRLRGHEQGYVGQFKFIGSVANSGMDLEKGHLPDIQRNSKASEEASPRSNDGSVSAFFDRSAGFQGPNVTAQTSQNMLELLNKVDKSRESRTGTHFGSTDSAPLSEVPHAETPESSIALSYNSSSDSQCFGLRLAPPSQRLPNSNCFNSSQSSLQTGNSTATLPSGPPYMRNQFQDKHLPGVPMSCQSPQATLPCMESRFPDFNPATSQDTSRLIHSNHYSQQFPILEAVPVTRPSATSGMPRQVGYSMRPANLWTNVPTQWHLSGTEPRKALSSVLPSPDSTNSSLGTASGAPQELHNQNSLKGGNNSLEIGAPSMNSQGLEHGREQPGKERSHQQISLEIFDPVSQTGRLSHGQEFLAQSLSEVNATASGSSLTSSHQQGFDKAQHSENQAPPISAGDLEAFGRSLKPSHVLHQNYSLLHQVHSPKNVETGPSMRVSAKNNGVDSNLNFQQATAIAGQQVLYGYNSGFRNLANGELNAVPHLNSFPSVDNKILNFSSETGGDQLVKGSSQSLLQDTPQEMVTFSHNDCQSNVANKTEQSQISLQMAPSWFKHLKNGQMLSMYDARAANNPLQQFSLGKPFENVHMNSSMVRVNSASASQIIDVWPTTATTSVAVKHLSPPFMLPPDATDQNLAVLRPKKRKIAAFELLPWHKEVTQGSQRLQNISMAELEWAQTANRLIEKVEDDPEMIEDMLPMLRPKKRLILTTQLMQQVFRPAPAVILAADATSNCDSAVYFAARLVLGDACSLTSDSHKPSDNREMSSEKPKISERTGDQDFSKIVEGFINRTKRLEGDLLRLDKRASVVDISVESQDLEKFSIINRFAKFHSRGQAAETSSSCGTTPIVMKAFPQRYVMALPMPRTVPEGAHCLSL